MTDANTRAAEACEGRPGAMIVTPAGVLALLGVNDAGVAVCVNSIPMIAALRGKGAPVEGWISLGPPSERGYRTFTLDRAADR